MSCFYFFVFCLFSICSGQDDLRSLDRIVQEEPCARAGGMCTIQCPKDLLAEEPGLCPRQRSSGVECCYGTSAIETRCVKKGGTCQSGFCNRDLIARDATDCPEGQQCCILV